MEDIRGDCQCGHKVTAHNTQGCHALGCACTAIYDYTNDMAPWESDEAGTGALQLVIAWLEQNGHGKDDEHSRKLHKGCYACRILIECRKELNEIAALRTQLGKANIALEVCVSIGIHDVRMRWANGAVCEDCCHELCNMVRNLRAEVMRLTGELAAVRRERDDVKEALHATVSNTESMTYGELPNSLQELIHPHEFDNMTISEQRAWSIGRFADVTQELDETLEAATQQYEEELAACRNPDHKMTLLESIKWLVAERNLALARNAALSALLHEWQQTPYFETHDHWSVWVTSFGARVEEALSQVRGGGHE